MKIGVYIKLVLIVVMIMTIGCAKDGSSKYLYPEKFTCTVNGVPYEDYKPYLQDPGMIRSPFFIYQFNEENKELFFNSFLWLVNSGEHEVRNYSVTIKIPLKNSLELHKEYLFEGIPGEDRGMMRGYGSRYYERGLPYCSVYADFFSKNTSFGTGKIIIESFQKERTRAKGRIEFTIPSPQPGKEGEMLTFKGHFEDVALKKY